MLHNGVSDAPHEVFLRVASAAGPHDDKVSALAPGEFHQLGSGRSCYRKPFRGKPVVPQCSCGSGGEFVGLTPEESFHLIAHRKSPCGKTDAFQGEGRDHGGDDHSRT
jgi:hypothetical protein